MSKIKSQFSLREKILTDERLRDLYIKMLNYNAAEVKRQDMQTVISEMLADIDPFMTICLNALVMGIDIDALIYPSFNLQNEGDRKLLGIKILAAMDSMKLS